jgi:transposase
VVCATPALPIVFLEDGRVVLRKKLSRTNRFAFLANLPQCLIGMEAGSAAH